MYEAVQTIGPGSYKTLIIAAGRVNTYSTLGSNAAAVAECVSNVLIDIKGSTLVYIRPADIKNINTVMESIFS